MGNYREGAWTQTLAHNGAHFVRACAVEIYVNISQQPLYTEISRKNATVQNEHPHQAPAFTPTLRTFQCGHRLGNETMSIQSRIV